MTESFLSPNHSVSCVKYVSDFSPIPTELLYIAQKISQTTEEETKEKKEKKEGTHSPS